MEIENVQRIKYIEIDTEKAEVKVSYTAKITVKVQNKEVEIEKRLWKNLPLRYDSNDVTMHLELIDETMNSFEKQMNEIIEKIKKTFTDLEQILEKYGYQVI